MICVECGAETPGLLQGCCAPCYVAGTPIIHVPDVLDLEFCAHCDAQRVGSHWQDTPHDVPLEWVRQEAEKGSVRVHPDVTDVTLASEEVPQDDKHFRFHVRVSGVLEGLAVEDKASFLTRTKRGVCDRCSRRAGGFWAALIQLRASERDVSARELEKAHRTVAEELFRASEAGNRLAFLQKESPMHGGWDYYIGDIDAGRNCSRLLKERLNAKVQETAKLVGRRNGEDVYRVTFLVRIQLFAPGDVALDREDRLLVVSGADQGRVQAYQVVDHRRTRAQEDHLRRVGGPELAQEAVLVSEDPANLQVLDPETLRTVDLPRPEGHKAAGGSVMVLRHEGRLYLAPPPLSKSS